IAEKCQWNCVAHKHPFRQGLRFATESRGCTGRIVGKQELDGGFRWVPVRACAWGASRGTEAGSDIFHARVLGLRSKEKAMTCLRTFVTTCGVALLASGFFTPTQPEAQARLSSSTASASAECTL